LLFVRYLVGRNELLGFDLAKWFSKITEHISEIAKQ